VPVAMDIEQRLIDMGAIITGIATNATEARLLFGSKTADLVLLDIHLGDEQEDGIDLAAFFQKQHVPFIFLTAFSDTPTFSRALKLVPAGYLLKPFQNDDLGRQLRLALASKKQQEKNSALQTLCEEVFFTPSAPAALFDTDKRILGINQLMERCCGYTTAEVQRVEATRIFEIDSNNKLQFIRHRNGEKIYETGELTAIKNQQKSITGYLLKVNESATEKTKYDFPASIFIRVKGQLLKISVSEINWLEALDNYTTIHTNAKRYTVKLFLKDVLLQLSPEMFVRIHRSFAVAVNQITSIEDDTIYIGSQALPVGRHYKSELMKQITLF
jgi:DNA-binding LytR/AlgR family response regulator